MKKILALLLAAVMVLSMAACGNNANTDETQAAKTAARNTDHTGAFHQFHTELFGIGISFRKRRPYKHGAFTIRNIPSDIP